MAIGHPSGVSGASAAPQGDARRTIAGVGYYSTRRRKTEAERYLGPVEIICIVLAVVPFFMPEA